MFQPRPSLLSSSCLDDSYSLQKWFVYQLGEIPILQIEEVKLKFPHFPTNDTLDRCLPFFLNHLHMPLITFISLYEKCGLTKVTKLFRKKIGVRGHTCASFSFQFS